GRNTQRREELEVFVLHVLSRVRRKVDVGEEPAEVARACAVEAESDRSAGEGREHAGLDVILERERDVELSCLEGAPGIEKAAPTARAFDDDDVVDRRMAADQRCRSRLQQP